MSATGECSDDLTGRGGGGALVDRVCGEDTGEGSAGGGRIFTAPAGACLLCKGSRFNGLGRGGGSRGNFGLFTTCSRSGIL